MEREALSKLNFLLFSNRVGCIFFSTHLIEEMVRLIIWLSHFTFNMLEIF